MRTICMPAYKVAKVTGPEKSLNDWPNQGPSSEAVIFYDVGVFGKAQKLSVGHKLVKCYGNLQDKFKRTTLLR